MDSQPDLSPKSDTLGDEPLGAWTPSPWSVTEGEQNRIIWGPDGDVIAEVHWWIAEHAAEAVANADIIRAAPEYRAALERIIQHDDMRAELYTNDADFARNVAAIARGALATADARTPTGSTGDRT